MFDVGFWEVILIGGLALVILGPERLPKVAREVGRWAGRARAMARQLRSQLEQEISYDEYMRTQAPRPDARPGSGAASSPPSTPSDPAAPAPDSEPAAAAAKERHD